MIIIQNVTIEEVTFSPEGGKVVYFKMHPKVTTVLELSSKIDLKACKTSMNNQMLSNTPNQLPPVKTLYLGNLL